MVLGHILVHRAAADFFCSTLPAHTARPIPYRLSRFSRPAFFCRSFFWALLQANSCVRPVRCVALKVSRLGESCYEFAENLGPIRVQKVVAIRSLAFRWRVVSAVLYH
jgi:hypothetical protein